MSFIPYTTTGGETWSLLAYKAYGDEYNIKPITDANPELALTAILDAGIKIKIPIITSEGDTTDVALLPFWKK